MRPKTFNLDPANVDPNGLCAAITGAGPWTLAGDAEYVAESVGDNLAHQLNLTSAADLSAITMTLTGTDADSKALTENVTGPNATTVESSGYFLTLTGVSASATLGANTLDIGWVDEFVTVTWPLNWRAHNGAAAYAVDVSGTIDYIVQETFEDIRIVTSPNQDAFWYALSDPTGTTVDLAAIGTNNATAVRLGVLSYTDTAEIQFHISQN